jgi:hypothetical protein
LKTHYPILELIRAFWITQRAMLLAGGNSLSTADEYRERAVECLRLARATKDEASKIVLLEMAQVWIKLALKLRGEEGNGEE